MAESTFPKSVTQARLEQHEEQFERMNRELGKSKAAGHTATHALYESMGEMRFELEAIEGRERETRLQVEQNMEVIENANSTIESLNKAYRTLSQVLNEELESIRNDHGSRIEVRVCEERKTRKGKAASSTVLTS